MADENQQQVQQEPQRVTTKNPKKVEAGKRRLHTIIGRERKREKNKCRRPPSKAN